MPNFTRCAPLISVVIPYYNQPSYIMESVASATKQSYPNVEVIVVDDGSSFPAEGVLASETGVTLIRTKNQGVSGARNIGFSRSLGQYVIFLDQDDRLTESAIEDHLIALNSDPNSVLSFGKVKVIDRYGKVIRPPRICGPRKNYFLMLLETNPICSPGAVMIKRDALTSVGLFDCSFSSVGEDYDLYLRLARIGSFARHTSCVLEYRKHDSNESRAQEHMLRGTMRVLDKLEPTLSVTERSRVRHARKRWEYAFHSDDSLLHELKKWYYRFYSLNNLSLRTYLRELLFQSGS